MDVTSGVTQGRDNTAYINDLTLFSFNLKAYCIVVYGQIVM